ncbi:hypothetical protein HYN48_13840 [Flavobacterium magnum]|uniref:Lipoprotein n=1 Tax=Flavobacterium magnum TaxID=2162713 RepID=A0A2S0RII6_9FLAO|nr:hypothetical protein [Flavobacterium magnum]AWA31080.1 hypothetical protein HYN48_13840 [Flavobacterium magnum]
MIKKLVVINLFILFLPFFQTCSDDNISHNKLLKNSPLSEVVDENATEVSENEKEFNYTFEELTLKKQETIKNFNDAKQDLMVNGYEAGFIFISDLPSPPWVLLPYTISIILIFSLVIFSFLKNYRAVFFVGIANLLMLSIPLLLLYLGKIFDDINQIQIGYYLLFYNLILIIFESMSLLKSKNIR